MASATAVAAGTGQMTRREFLYYIWGASLALYMAQFAGLLVWFLIPRFREGEFGGTFTIPIEDLADINGEPINYPDGRFWLVNLDTDEPNERMALASDEPEPIKGVAAIYKVCTHLGCIYAWTPANDRFECPCHGSKYRLDGRRIDDPAPRSLDRFKIAALDANGSILAEAEPAGADSFFQPLELPSGTAFIQVDTGDRIEGPQQTLLANLSSSVAFVPPNGQANASASLLCDFTSECP